MINIKELIEDLMAEGLSKEEATKQAAAIFRRKHKHCKKENIKYAAKTAKNYNSVIERCTDGNLKRGKTRNIR